MPEALSIRSLRFRYAPLGPCALRLDELLVAPAEQVLIRGPSGSGKSTLLHLIAGLLDEEPGRLEGSIEVAGQQVMALRGARRDLWRGRHLGMIFQTFQLLPTLTALENVMLALHFAGERPAAQRQRAAELLAELGIERPHSPCEELSVGQQQRVAVARAVACRPALVLADEPTASLDLPTATTAMELIQETCRGRGAALVCASHDPSLAGRFARSIEL
jgi:ABC-type lipoprotein export system ATPase subunit